MEKRLEVFVVFFVAPKKEPIKMICLEYLEGYLSNIFEVVVEVGSDMPFDSLRFITFPTSLSDLFGNIFDDAIKLSDFSCENFIPFTLSPIKSQNTYFVVLAQDRRQRADIGIFIENDPVSRRARETKNLPKILVFAREYSKSRIVVGSEILGAELTDFF
jgi:hypothetical protein